MRGIGIFELVITVAMLTTLLGSVASGILLDSRAHDAIVMQLGPEMKLYSALARIATELRMSGEWGEDRDHNGQLDDGEDLNGNDVLDANWSLADGATAQELHFNVRTDERDSDGYLVSAGIYSTRITWRLDGNRLVREQMIYEEDGTDRIIGAVMAQRVASLQFSRTGGLIRVRVEVDVPLAGGKVVRRPLQTDVWMRN